MPIAGHNDDSAIMFRARRALFAAVQAMVLGTCRSCTKVACLGDEYKDSLYGGGSSD